MTEMEKARAGLEFIRGDATLRSIRERAESLCFRLNHTPPEEGEKRSVILKELIPNQGENCFIKPPFLCDYGEFIVVGRTSSPTTAVSSWTAVRSASETMCWWDRDAPL